MDFEVYLELENLKAEAFLRPQLQTAEAYGGQIEEAGMRLELQTDLTDDHRHHGAAQLASVYLRADFAADKPSAAILGWRVKIFTFFAIANFLEYDASP